LYLYERIRRINSIDLGFVTMNLAVYNILL